MSNQPNSEPTARLNSGPNRKVKQRNLPDQIVDLFLALIFTGDLKPGDRLPPELELAKILRVNQSSLRMAMRVLARMKVIESTRGSGLVVLDYKIHAGVDFMAELIRIPELTLGSKFLIDMLEGTPKFIAEITKSAFKELDAMARVELGALQDLKYELCKKSAPSYELADIEIRLQDLAAQKISNPLFSVLYNSFRPIRLHLTNIYYQTEGDKLEHMENQRELRILFLKGKIDLDELIKRHQILLEEEMEEVKNHLQGLPQESYLKTSPLQHFPEMISLQNQN